MLSATDNALSISRASLDRASRTWQCPICNRTTEHLGPTDLGIIATRRRVLKAARELEAGIEPPAAPGGDLYHLRSAAVTIDTIANIDDDPSVRAAMTAQA